MNIALEFYEHCFNAAEVATDQQNFITLETEDELWAIYSWDWYPTIQYGWWADTHAEKLFENFSFAEAWEIFDHVMRQRWWTGGFDD